MRTWYQDDYVGGFIDENGHFDVCEEYNLSDADSDKYAVEVQNMMAIMIPTAIM